MIHQKVGPKEKIKRGQIKLTEAFSERRMFPFRFDTFRCD
jgi:hypothetical protein